MGTVGCGEGAVGVGCSLVDLAPEPIDGGDDYATKAVGEVDVKRAACAES